MHHKPINHARRDAGKKDGELGTEEKEGDVEEGRRRCKKRKWMMGMRAEKTRRG